METCGVGQHGTQACWKRERIFHARRGRKRQKEDQGKPSVTFSVQIQGNTYLRKGIFQGQERGKHRNKLCLPNKNQDKEENKKIKGMSKNKLF